MNNSNFFLFFIVFNPTDAIHRIRKTQTTLASASVNKNFPEDFKTIVKERRREMLPCRVIVALFVISSFQLSTVVSHYVLNYGPCDVMDTVNISSGHLDQHGEFHHNGIVYKKGTFGEYEYIVKNFTKIKVETHVRGCICKYKPCIRVCCKSDDPYDSCVKSESISVTLKDGEEEEIDLNKGSYGVLIGKPCEKTFALEPEEYDYDQWVFSVSYTKCDSAYDAIHT